MSSSLPRATLRALGPLRLALCALVLVCLLASLLTDSEGLVGLMAGNIAPGIAVLLLWALPFDLLLMRIFQRESSHPPQATRLALRVEALFWLLLLLAWLPFFARLFTR